MRTLMRMLTGFIAAGLLTAMEVSHAAETGARLVEEARCYACHQMQENLLGPPYLAIAARHAQNRAVMVDVLAYKIVRGGGGNWGQVPMVPNQWVSIEDARVMAEWILGLAD